MCYTGSSRETEPIGWIHTHTHTHTHTHRHFCRFIIRNWLTQLWRLTRSIVWAPQVWTQESSGAVPVLRPTALAFRPRKSWCFPLTLKVGETIYPISEAVRQENSLWLRRRSEPQQIRWGPPTLVVRGRREVCFAQSPNSNVNLIPNTLTDTPRIMFDQTSAYPVTLTHRINHHRRCGHALA